MKVKSLLAAISIAVYIPITSLSAQTVNIGDICPDIALDNLMNYSNPTASLSTFKGKHILVDLWATWCAVCIDKLGELEHLQQKYSDKLQIILVTAEPREKVESLLKRYDRFKGIQLLIATGDSLFRKYFPHSSVPHEIWIDSSGKVLAITGGDEVSDDNISAFTNNKLASLTIKRDFMDYSINKPLIASVTELSAPDASVTYANSYFGNYLEGLSGRLTNSPYFNSRNQSIKLTGINVDISNLYRMAYRLDSKGPFYSGKVIHEYSDKEKFTPDYVSGMNLFCYEITLPLKDSSSLFIRIRSDLDNNLGVHSMLMRRSIPCIILKSLANDLSVPLPSGPGDLFFDNEKMVVRNLSSRNLISNVFPNWEGLRMPVLDESGFPGLISMELPKSFNLGALINELRKYNLTATISQREMEVVVLRDR